MKKTILLLLCLFGSAAIFAQTEKQEGDELAAEENYSAAAMMYRLCMEQDEECQLKLIRLIYEEKVEPQFTNELFQLIDPLAKKGNAEVQFYLATMYENDKGIEKNQEKAIEYYQKSAGQGHTLAQTELDKGTTKQTVNVTHAPHSRKFSTCA